MKLMNHETVKNAAIATAFVATLALAVITTGCVSTGSCPTGQCGNSGMKPETKAEHSLKEAEITTPVLERLLSSKASVTVLDARTGKYDDGFRIPGARSLGADAPEKEVQTVLPSKTQLIVTYCSNLKCPASHKLAGRLRELGYVNVLEYPFGIAGWKEAGNKVVRVN